MALPVPWFGLCPSTNNESQLSESRYAEAEPSPHSRQQSRIYVAHVDCGSAFFASARFSLVLPSTQQARKLGFPNLGFVDRSDRT